MQRPFCCRRIAGRAAATVFGPIGIAVRQLEEVVLTLDEFEAIRLADLGGLYQEQVAEQMNVSRPRFSRIVDSARRKLADSLVHGKAPRTEGGPVQMQSRQVPPRTRRGEGVSWHGVAWPTGHGGRLFTQDARATSEPNQPDQNREGTHASNLRGGIALPCRDSWRTKNHEHLYSRR